jgi:hypothetical protein
MGNVVQMWSGNAVNCAHGPCFTGLLAKGNE